MEETTQNTSGGANKMSFIAVAVIALLVLGGVAFFMTQNSARNAEESASQDKMAGEPTVSDAMPEKTESTTEEGDVKEFTVAGQNFSFDVKEMRVKKGDKVRIVFKNEAGFHDWVLDEFNAKTKQIQAGETDTVEFTADKVGTFEYYCSVGSHRQMGMVGNLIVE